MESNNVWVVQFLKQLELVIYHLFIAAHIPLENDLDGYFSRGAFGFSNDAISARTQRPTESILGPISD